MAEVFKLKTFGVPELKSASGECMPVATRKSLAILAFLTRCQGFSASRESLADLFWSGVSRDKSAQSLRQALRQIKRATPGGRAPVLVCGRNHVAVNTQVIFSDLMETDGLLRSGLAQDFTRAKAIVTGPFLSGFEAIDPHFSEWLQIERQRVEDDLISKALKIIGDLRPEAQAVRIEAAARFILHLDSSHEHAHRILISALLAVGRRAEAEQQLEICKTELQAALDVQPEHSTLALLESVPQRPAGPPRFEYPYATPGALIGESADLVGLPELTIVRLGGRTEQSPLALSALDEIRTSLAAYRNLDLYDHSLTLTDGSNWELTRVEGGELGSFLLRFRHDPVTACLYLQLERRDTGRVQFNEVIDLGGIRDIEDLKASCFQAVDRIQGHIIGRLRSRPGAAPFSRWCQAEALLWEFSLSSDQSALKILDELTSTHPSFSLPHAGKTAVILKRFTHSPLSSDVSWRLDEALKNSERAILLDPWQVFPQRINAWALSFGGDTEQAKRGFREAERLNPRDPFNLMSVAEGLAFLGEFSAAKQLSQKALAKVSIVPRAFYEYLGNIHFSVGEYAYASEMLSKAPNDSMVALATRVSSLLNQGSISEAQRVLEVLRAKTLARFPNDGSQNREVVRQWLHQTNMYHETNARSAYARGSEFILSGLGLS